MATIYTEAKKAINAYAKSPFTYINLVNKEKETFAELLQELGVSELTITDFYTGESTDQRPMFCKLVPVRDSYFTETAITDLCYNFRVYGNKTYQLVPITKKVYEVNGKQVEAFSTSDFIDCLKSMAIYRAAYAATEKELTDTFNGVRSIEHYISMAKAKYGDLPTSVLEQIARADMKADLDSSKKTISMKAAKAKAASKSKAKAA